MARDYGGRGPAKRKKNAPHQLIGILASFLCGYLTATVFDYNSLSNWINHNVLAEKPEAQPQAKVAPQRPELPKPKFEFYTLLSKDNRAPGEISHRPSTAPLTKPAVQPQPVQPAASLPAPSSIQSLPKTLAAEPQKQNPPVIDSNAQTTVRQGSYSVQLAAFNKRQDAEHLKATLALKGYNASISTIIHHGTNWFRVVLGPFSTFQEADKAQVAMSRSERIKGIIRKDSSTI